MSDEHPATTFSEVVYNVAGGVLGVVATVLRPFAAGWDLADRLGRGDRLPEEVRPLWLHGSSVGEVSTLRPLVTEVQRRVEGIDWGLSSTTPTGAREAARRFPDASFRRLLPLDLWPATNRFLASVHPGAALIVETELWPRLLLSLARSGVPVALASARLTDSSFDGYRRFGGLFRQVLQSIDLIATRSEEDRERFLELGADARRTVVLGNTKLDNVSDEAPSLGAKQARLSRLARDRPLVVWGSLRPGEEEVVASTIRALEDAAPALWVLAPRHPREFDRTVENATRAGFRTARWSAEGDDGSEPVDILVLDTLGELRAFYALSTVAVVGGSFGDYGGHNLMEPAAYGVPVLFGPDTSEWPDDTAALIESGGGACLRDAGELRERLVRLLHDPEERRRMGRLAHDAATEGKGASRRVVEALLEIGFFDGVSRVFGGDESGPSPVIR